MKIQQFYTALFLVWLEKIKINGSSRKVSQIWFKRTAYINSNHYLEKCACRQASLAKLLLLSCDWTIYARGTVNSDAKLCFVSAVLRWVGDNPINAIWKWNYGILNRSCSRCSRRKHTWVAQQLQRLLPLPLTAHYFSFYSVLQNIKYFLCWLTCSYIATINFNVFVVVFLEDNYIKGK